MVLIYFIIVNGAAASEEGCSAVSRRWCWERPGARDGRSGAFQPRLPTNNRNPLEDTELDHLALGLRIFTRAPL